MDGGWWEGSLNGVVGWFPSNYVVPVSSDSLLVDDRGEDDQHLHLRTFQDEIVQHILEGEVRQVSELAQLISGLLVHLEPFSHLPFLNKVGHMKELLNQAIHLHQTLASALDQMKQSSEPKRVGKLFLDFASTINAIGCDYSKIHLYVVTGIDKNADTIERHMSACGMKFQPSRCKQQLSLVFDRLGRYPLLLKEMERYLENPHVDRIDIQRAMSIYGEITERCAILRKFKEYDIDILLSTINGWQGLSIDKLGDPILTLRVLLTAVECESSPTNQATNVIPSGGQLSVLVIFPTCVLLLARNKAMDVYEFTKKIPLSCLTVLGCFETEADVDLLVTGPSSEPEPIQPCRISLTCTDQNARDLLVSTLTDLIHYQTQMEQMHPDRSLQDRNPSTTADVPTSTTTMVTENLTTTLVSLNRDQTECLGVPSEPECTCSPEQSSHVSGRSQRTSPGRDLVQSTRKSSSDQKNFRASDTAGQKDLCNISGVSGSAVSLVNIGVSSKLVGESDAPVTLSPSPSNGIRTIPHLIQTNAHVRWPGIDTVFRDKEDVPPPSSRVLRCLRLDSPLNANMCPSGSSTGYVNWAASSGSQFAASGEHDPGGPLPLLHATHTRPHSPKGDSSREVRRKKSDRQKSAINVDEVLRSVEGMPNNSFRTHCYCGILPLSLLTSLSICLYGWLALFIALIDDPC
ncbi:putative Pak-interacting exchange factor beta-pix/cool-1 [Fasciolopsis buskii]|uniref:Putative Pak-interacting exchange factor beta-pix/cool-1 n=1 Tax=Fasciolopsis buskii TaxID=27845 RepID=A0A8E0VKY3_9TREM|nr:putative Pak-interacting exchange factor beta-pix/cool-1 [Fasciolopsis buski]